LEGATGLTGASGNAGDIGATGIAGDVGATGLQGATGFDGATGATGLDGATGLTGSTGVDGATGATGTQGDVGATGSTGATGVIGDTGSTGATGVAGLDGSTGATGVAGSNGATGATGVSGGDGATGATGITGATGLTGDVGATGIQGDIGATGSIGLTGEQGATGATGIQGDVGATGLTGETGATGIQGNEGATGATGVQGEVGATGIAGIDGATGATGTAGGQGSTGATGIAGTDGATGATGVQGEFGSTGATGLTGDQGSTGATGLSGNDGATGSTGATGLFGSTGATGIAGNDGATGSTGATGIQGPTPWTLPATVYNDATQYDIGDAVTYLGGYYYRTGNPGEEGITPTPGSITASWTPVADAGANGLGYVLTSSFSRTIGLGSITFGVNLISASSAFTAGNRVRIIATASPTNWMEGIVTSYTTSTFIVNVDLISGSGTYNSWRIGIAGEIGATGIDGATGATGIGASGATGATGLQGATGLTGAGGASGFWGSFWSNQDQSAANTTTAYPITFNNTDPDSIGVSVVSNSQITFANAGVYNIQFSAQADRVSGSGSDSIDIWFRKNGTDIPESNGVITVAGGAAAAKTIASWNYMLKLSAGDYVELVWRTSDTNLQLIHEASATSPTRPAIPSVIVTAQQVMYTQLGATGATGVGATGLTGDAGATGATGLTGDAGATGAAGATGPSLINYWIPAAAWIPRTTTGCGVDSRELATNLTNYDELLFDPATNEFAQALHILPSNYNNSTITARFYWTSSTGSGAVVWGLQGRAYADGNSLDQAFGTAQTVTDTLITTNSMHVTSATSAITIAGTPAANCPILFQIYRDAAAGGDTLASDARFLGVEILFN
jgi:hypothetical protein